MDIKYNVIGIITEGENSGWYIKIIDDRENTGGYYIFEFQDANSDEGFDTWLETENDLRGYIDESEWKIEWME